MLKRIVMTFASIYRQVYLTKQNKKNAFETFFQE